MRGPETTFIASVHRLLPPVDELHHEKMNNPYHGGTADVWYSGQRDLWVEYKFIMVPKRASTMIDFTGGKNPVLSGLQQDWLKRRHIEGRNVWVIVGCKAGGVVMDNLEWMQSWETSRFIAATQSRRDLADRLRGFLEHL